MSEEHHEFVLQAIAYDNAELLAELLLERPLLANCHDEEGRAPLHHAAAGGHAKCAALLIGSGADVDAVAGPQDTVKTPLGLASSSGHCAVVELLVTNGADLFYVDSDGHSALQLAQIGGHHSVATLLMGTIERIYADAEQKNQRLCAACIDGKVGPVLDILSDLGPKSTRKQILNGRMPGEQKSALFLAAEHGRADIVRALLTVQYHSIIFEPSGDTIKNPDQVLHAAIASQNLATVELILHKFPFLMDAPNEEGSLPLHWACRCGNARIVQALLGTEYPTEELKFFAFRQQDRANCEEEGYVFVCDLNAADQEGRSAFFLAVIESHHEVVQVLAKYKLPISNGTSSSHGGMLRVEQSQDLTEHPILFDTRANGKTPLMVACANGAVEIVRVLLEQCHVDVNYCSPPIDGGSTDGRGGALAEAANSGRLDVLRALFGQGAFDYGNRTLKGVLANGSGGYCSAEMVGLFLQQLAHLDSEPCVRSPRQRKEGGRQQQRHSRVLPIVESLLANASKVPLSATDHLPPKGCCQLNWQATGICELRSEWMVDAVLRLNPQIPRHLGKSLAFHAISRMDLSSNQLCSVPHFLFTHLHSLRSLDLSKNGIHRLEVPPDVANWQMPCLERLCLDENQLEELPKQLFSAAHLPRLCFCSATSNRLRRLPSAVWTAPRLRELHLANNLIGELNGAAVALQELRRATHWHRTTGAGTGGASSARISRQRQREAVEGRSEVDDGSERQSRPMLKRRESPSQHQQTTATTPNREATQEAVDMMGKSQSTDNETEEDGAATPRGGRGGTTAATMLLEMDIQRVNIWQEKIHVSNIDDDGPMTNGAGIDEESVAINGGVTSAQKDDGDGTTRCSSRLQLLDLAHNKFARMPTCLACCCPRLAKLDLSSNSLSSLGPVGCLPSALRHLDVSKNQLVRLFGGENPAQLRQKLRFCDAQPEFGGAGTPSEGNGTTASNEPMPRHSRSRSKSVARSQRSLSVVRKSGGEGGQQLQNELLLLNSFCCVHKSHCRMEALKTLNLAQNLLEYVDILLPMGGGMDGENSAVFSVPANGGENGEKQFNWRENSELLKPFMLFPSLTSLDLSQNRIRQLPPAISLLSSLAMLNMANNAELDSLAPELGLLERLWTIGLGGCQLRAEEPALQALVQAGSYKTRELLSQLRQRLENSMPYPMLKLMLLGGSSVGKSTLLQKLRLEGTTPKRNDSWARRRHSPNTPQATASSSAAAGRAHRSRFVSQHRPPTGTSSSPLYSSAFPVDVFEWVYEPPKRSSSSTAKGSATPSSQHSSAVAAAAADSFQGPITFRVWDFDGIKQREYQSVQRCFFTRRSLFLLLWKVTDGDIALADLHDFLLAIQAQAPNSYVLIVGTHSDFVREQTHRFPRDYLSQMDKQIQDRFILGADPEKNGLPRVLGSLYISCCAREDVRSLCAFIYTCATEIRQFSRGGGSARQRLLAQKVPASFVSLENIVATMMDEFRATGKEPIMHFNEFWSLAIDRLSQRADSSDSTTTSGGGGGADAGRPMHFRGAQDFRQACLFLHENGVICYYDDTFLRDFVFLDPPWLCANLYGILAFAALRRCSAEPAAPSPFVAFTSLSQMHQNSVIESVELYTALKRTVRQNLALLFSTGGVLRPSAEVSFNSHFRLFRQCVMGLLRKFELALPFQYGRMSLLASCLPDEYVLRADYPGSKVLVRNKFDKLRIRWNDEKEMTAFVPKNAATRPPPVKMSPIRNYLQHRRLSRAVAPSIDNLNGAKLAERDRGMGGESDESNKSASLIRILAVDHCKEECLRRLYMMHYIPPGFWARLSTRLLDDDRIGHVLAKLFLLSPASHANHQQQQHGVAISETDQQQQQLNQQQQLIALSSPAEAIVAAFSRALNAGRIVNLAQRCSSTINKWGASAAAEEEAENVPEEETSFIVVNSADEVTEEFAFNSNEANRDEPSSSGTAVVIKCCERGVEAIDEQCHANASGRSRRAKAGDELGNALEWMLWRSGVEVGTGGQQVRCFGTFLLSLRQFLPLASVSDVNYASHALRRRFDEGQWAPLSAPTASDQHNLHVSSLSHVVELLIPKVRVRFRWHDTAWELETDSRMAARLLSLITGAMDDLLEDAYPQLGTRFILSPQGRPLVDRLIPCDRCAVEAIREEERYWLRENINRNPTGGKGHCDMSAPAAQRMAKSASTKFKSGSAPKRAPHRVPKSKSSTETPLSQQQPFATNKLDNKATAKEDKNVKGTSESRDKVTSTTTASHCQPVHLFSIEECIVEARRQLQNVEKEQKGPTAAGGQRLECPRHGIVRWSAKERQTDTASAASSTRPDLHKMAPDLLFVDLENEWAVPSVCIQRGKLIGRGAFGFVFTGKLAFVPPSSPPAFKIMATDDDNKQTDEVATVALKQFEPVDPNNGDADGGGLAMSGASDQAAIRAFALKWQNDGLEQVTRAYCTARQELCMLSELRHAHCTSMVAFCSSPLTLLMELAPHGALNKLLADHRRFGHRLHLDTVQMCCLQIARALEYLHVQQHIIYRDLKSENVLVWRFPSPSEFSDRSTTKKYVPRDVLVKLGDYGISRFSHPFGMCKGYGGTEGFMAPEIMRYNGEQEYSERVDCFSFGMFIYELLTLKQPYEGQPVQQMKERILEAQRPAVSEKELLFATNILDLMIACWEERAERRPSSSQLVEICSAPEFSHLLDVALLRGGEDGAAASALFLASRNPPGTTTAANCANEWSIWMPIVGGGVQQQQQQLDQRRKGAAFFALLKCNQFGWAEKKEISIQNDHCSANASSDQQQRSPSKKQRISHQKQHITEPKITTLAQIYDEFVWMGDELGIVNIFELDEQRVLVANPAAPLYKIDSIKMLDESGQTKTEKEGEKAVVHASPSPSSSSSSSTTTAAASVRHIAAFHERRLVIVGLTMAVLLCRWHGRESPPQLVCCIRLNPIPSLGTAAHLFSMAVLRSLSDWQLWTGHAAGHIFMHFISSATDRLTFSTSANHYAMAESVDNSQQTKKQPQTAPSSRRKVAFLVASNCTKNLAWSAMDGDPRLFMWRDSQLQKTLNSAKILPISESLSSMDNFSANFQPSDDGIGTQNAVLFVTALEVMDLCSDQQKRSNMDGQDADEEQLLVGTSNGVVLILRAIEMSPLSAFRPYCCAVERIICCPAAGHCSSRILQNELLLSSSASKTHPNSSARSSSLVSQHSVHRANTDRHSKKRSLLLLEKSRSIMLKATGSAVGGSDEDNCQRLRMSASTSMPGGQIALDFRNAAVSAADELCETVREGMRGIFAGAESAEARGAVAAKKGEARETFFVSIGKGYRPLLNRFVSSAEINALSNRHKEEKCAIFWRSTREWACDQK